MPIDPENDSATTGGFTRRTGLAAAWSAPVVAAALSAPGAAASGVSPNEGPFLGVSITSLQQGTGTFRVNVRIGGAAPDFGTPLTLPIDSRVDITSAHDVVSWGEGIVVDGPRAGHILIPAGVYETDLATFLLDDSRFVVGNVTAPSGRPSVFTPQPSGGFAVTATVTAGPVYTGTEPAVPPAIGNPTRTVTISI